MKFLVGADFFNSIFAIILMEAIYYTPFLQKKLAQLKWCDKTESGLELLMPTDLKIKNRHIFLWPWRSAEWLSDKAQL